MEGVALDGRFAQALGARRWLGGTGVRHHGLAAGIHACDPEYGIALNRPFATPAAVEGRAICGDITAGLLKHPCAGWLGCDSHVAFELRDDDTLDLAVLQSERALEASVRPFAGDDLGVGRGDQDELPRTRRLADLGLDGIHVPTRPAVGRLEL